MPEVGYRVLTLRYFPNLPTQEFVNVGVALLSASGWWDLRVSRSLKHLKTVFPTAQPHALEHVLGRIERMVETSPRVSRDPLNDLRTCVGGLLGGMEWGEPPIEGVTTNPTADLERWFHLLVASGRSRAMLAEASSEPRSVPTTVRLMRQELETRGVWKRLKPANLKTIVRHNFRHTFLNQRLHIFEPISLDKSENSLVSTVELWRGRVDAIADDTQRRLSFVPLVQMPASAKLAHVAQDALQILKRTKAADVRLFTTDEIHEFGAFVQDLVEKH
jgi:hypothetical protein